MPNSHLIGLWGLIFLFDLSSDLSPHIGANALIPDGCNRAVAVKTFNQEFLLICCLILRMVARCRTLNCKVSMNKKMKASSAWWKAPCFINL